jgi:hypothetical protein
VCAITVCLCAASASGQNPPSGSIAIRVVEGDGALNDIKLKRAHAPVVTVMDSEGRLVAGATVTFLLPSSGAGGTFTDSGLSLTTQTDAKGMAVGRGLRPNHVPGQFRIRVTASRAGAVTSAAVLQTNVGAPPGNSRNKKIAILALIGGAAVGGVVAATQGGKSSAAASASSASTGGAGTGGGSTTIVGGPPSLGGSN